MSERLALHGGEPVRRRPFPSGKKVGKEELKELVDVIDCGRLFRWSGTKVKQFEQEFAALLGVPYAIASTSGTAAIHVAIGMVNPSPGDEIIVGPITDIGTVIPILFQTAIPIFADSDPETLNLDPEDVERKITPKTKAILPVHLFGNPCDMEALLAIGKKHGIPIIEDCSQAHLALYQGRKVGTIGDIGCFSLQESKHMTCGDGGITVTSNEEYGVRGMLFADKGWHRADYGPRRYSVLGMNYRMTELQGAVMCAQVRKVSDVVSRRRRNGELLTQLLEGTEGVRPQKVLPGCHSSYWLYALMVQPDAGFTADEFARALRAEGVPCGAHYIGKPIYLCHEAVRSLRLFGESRFPFDHPNARPGITYEEGQCPVTEDILNRMVTLPLNEFMGEEEMHDIQRAVQKVACLLRSGN